MGNRKQGITEGWVYALVNAGLPGLVKVGRTQHIPLLRARELASTGVPGRFTVAYCALVTDHVAVEAKAQDLLAPHHELKEFFRCDVSIAVSAIRIASARSGLLYERHAHGFESEPPTEVTALMQPTPASNDEFAAWARSIAHPAARFAPTPLIFQCWSGARSAETIGPTTMKAMVRALQQLGYRRARQGGTGRRGFTGLLVPTVLKAQ